MAAGSAAVELQSHEVEHEQRHASQHPQGPAKGRSLSQLELLFAMGVTRNLANYSDTCVWASLISLSQPQLDRLHRA